MRNQTIFGLFVIAVTCVMIECDPLAERFFLTMEVTHGSRGLQIKKKIDSIKKHLCTTSVATLAPVSCRHKYKVVGEPKVIVVVDVRDSTVFEKKMTNLMKMNRHISYRTEPLTDYGSFATFLGANVTTNFSINTLEDVNEAIWCEHNIDFGDKTTDEALDVWRQEAELVMNVRAAGKPLEIFKILGERKVHVIAESFATAQDQVLMSVPMFRSSPTSLVSTCDIVVKI